MPGLLEGYIFPLTPLVEMTRKESEFFNELMENSHFSAWLGFQVGSHDIYPCICHIILAIYLICSQHGRHERVIVAFHRCSGNFL